MIRTQYRAVSVSVAYCRMSLARPARDWTGEPVQSSPKITCKVDGVNFEARWIINKTREEEIREALFQGAYYREADNHFQKSNFDCTDSLSS